jgi:hypothetical protein
MEFEICAFCFVVLIQQSSSHCHHHFEVLESNAIIDVLALENLSMIVSGQGIRHCLCQQEHFCQG